MSDNFKLIMIKCVEGSVSNLLGEEQRNIQ